LLKFWWSLIPPLATSARSRRDKQLFIGGSGGIDRFIWLTVALEDREEG